MVTIYEEIFYYLVRQLEIGLSNGEIDIFCNLTRNNILGNDIDVEFKYIHYPPYKQNPDERVLLHGLFFDIVMPKDKFIYSKELFIRECENRMKDILLMKAKKKVYRSNLHTVRIYTPMSGEKFNVCFSCLVSYDEFPNCKMIVRIRPFLTGQYANILINEK